MPGVYDEPFLDNLFVALAKLTRSREDLLTYCLAAALNEDAKLARTFVAKLIGRKRIGRINLATANIVASPQVTMRSYGARIDLVLHVGPSVTVGLEHKLSAPEGPGQLAKYLGVPSKRLTFIAVIAARDIKLSAGVRHLSPRSRQRLLRPAGGRSHFLWADFYDLLADTNNPHRAHLSTLRRALVKLFDIHLLQAAHPSVGYLKHPDDLVWRKADEKFRVHWKRTIRALERRGWSVGESWTSKSELYAAFGSSDRLSDIRLDPRHKPGVLRVSLKARSRRARDEIHRRILRARHIPFWRHMKFDPQRLIPGQARGSWTLYVVIAWHDLFRRCTARGTIQRSQQITDALHRYVTGLVDIAA